MASCIYTIKDAIGSMVEGFERAEEIILDFYKHLLGKQFIPRSHINPQLMQAGPVLTATQQMEMCKHLQKRTLGMLPLSSSPAFSPSSSPQLTLHHSLSSLLLHLLHIQGITTKPSSSPFTHFSIGSTPQRTIINPITNQVQRDGGSCRMDHRKSSITHHLLLIIQLSSPSSFHLHHTHHLNHHRNPSKPPAESSPSSSCVS
ncbi:hypothetical protein Cgig2_032773 [Carnegiea gigantea]|uniref:Uncharacterized protein n=1 Tax=Carnegiea gigantea TaxID=171969 RepID=A0A9Q1GJV1_9CARY|nr:hypothetical protein Cgig2_032773 [Carnegiea gigantea]